MTPATFEAYRSRAATPSLGDIVALAKPRITMLVATTTAGGLWLAPGRPARWTALLTLLGVTMIVSGANALNMYIERDIDGRMERTARRPLPAGRMTPAFALAFGLFASIAAVPVLALGVNLTTAMLAVLAHLSYVLAYTPLKQRSALAVFVGAVPGAIPPLLGWTAVTSSVTAGGLVLFAILYFWQIPHFLAIATFRRDEYEKGGILVMPNTRGLGVTRRMIVGYSVLLVASSLLLTPLGIARPSYALTALLLGAAFVGVGAWSDGSARRARTLFVASLAYLVALFTAILLSAAT
jgi:heme o synthase